MTVSRRAGDALQNRLDAVAGRGHAFIEWWELHTWYGAERIAKGVWRDLRDRFGEAADDDAANLMFIENGNGILLIHSGKVEDVSKRAA